MDGHTEEKTLSAARPELTVVIPVFNEEGNLDDLYRRLVDTLESYGKTYEILFVDDGSMDRSFDQLEQLYQQHPTTVRVVRFVRNFGQQMAISAGLQYARGNVVVLMDADLQISPEDIPKLVNKLDEGYDIVYGIRTQRVGSLLRRIGSWGMSHLLYRITGLDVPDGASGFTALDRRFVNKINLFNERTKYFSGLFAWLSYGRWASVPVRHSARNAGRTKYNVAQLIALSLTFICNFTVLPLRLALYLGCLLAAVSGPILCWCLIAQIAGWSGRDNSMCLIVSGITFLSSVQLMAMGVIGEYVGRIYREVRQQPPFVVDKVLEQDTPTAR
ncbi:MAG: glycosyltransferase family 2 protein [Candidatus Hydrogenedentes bacterium]|nr:glycosyltransferase family 2 protein [Candidatus Hydrogenedentota bacterium]